MSPAQNESQLERAHRVLNAALELKAEEATALDVRALTSYADTLILVTGRSERHVRSIADAVLSALSKQGERPLGVEGHDEGSWILVDLGDLILHVFQKAVREHYDLERLWSDAPRLDVEIDQESALP